MKSPYQGYSLKAKNVAKIYDYLCYVHLVLFCSIIILYVVRDQETNIRIHSNSLGILVNSLGILCRVHELIIQVLENSPVLLCTLTPECFCTSCSQQKQQRDSITLALVPILMNNDLPYSVFITLLYVVLFFLASDFVIAFYLFPHLGSHACSATLLLPLKTSFAFLS